MRFLIPFLILNLIGCPTIKDHEADCGTTIICSNGFLDADGDGFCADVDCDDNDCAVNPGATEVCDYKDNDCDDLKDEEDDSLESTAEYELDTNGSCGLS